MSLDQRELSTPLGQISSTNQSGLILILTALSLCFVLFASGLRLYLRVILQKSWKWDDTASSIASALFLIQATIVFEEVHLGLGDQTVLDDQTEKHGILYKLYFANNLLYILTLVPTKLSICLLFLRITTRNRHVIAIQTIMAICTTWGIMSVLLVCIGVSLTDTLHVTFTRWLAIGVFDAITEVMFAAMAVYLVTGLQMKISRKCLVVLAFAIRLLMIPAISFRLYYLDVYANGTKMTSSMAISLAVALAQLELSYGILTGSITVLKPFVAVYEPSASSTANYKGYAGYASGDGSRYFRNDKNQYSYSVGHSRDEAQRKRTSKDSDTQAIMIQQQLRSTPTPHFQMEMDNIDIGHPRQDEIAADPIDQPQRVGLNLPGSDSNHDENGQKMIIRMKKGWKVHYEENDNISP